MNDAPKPEHPVIANDRDYDRLHTACLVMTADLMRARTEIAVLKQTLNEIRDWREWANRTYGISVAYGTQTVTGKKLDAILGPKELA